MLLAFVGNIGTYLAAVAGAPLAPDAFDTHVSKEAVSPISVLGVGLDSILPLVATGSTLLLMRFTWLVWTAGRDPRRRPDGELVSWLLVAAAGIVVPWLGAGGRSGPRPRARSSGARRGRSRCSGGSCGSPRAAVWTWRCAPWTPTRDSDQRTRHRPCPRWSRHTHDRA
ncbi:hypothetical protein ACIP1V_09205 [Kocuria marina]|uniref:hypothetical protein n=1 Tax=Kocuria marina TaxID=223184 RepID=UPI0038066729